MQDDVLALMDLLGLDVADLMGYSMGGFISSSLMVNHPQRFRSVILAGVGDALIRRSGPSLNDRAEAIATAMEAPDDSAAPTEVARGFRIFAERSGNDLKALAAMQRAPRSRAPGASFAEVRLPVMVLIGVGDTLVGSGEGLAAAIPGARLVKVPGDHLTAVGTPELKSAIIQFLAECSPR
jgi:pimeloyl-ACP methyl ester carboxylesterase